MIDRFLIKQECWEDSPARKRGRKRTRKGRSPQKIEQFRRTIFDKLIISISKSLKYYEGKDKGRPDVINIAVGRFIQDLPIQIRNEFCYPADYNNKDNNFVLKAYIECFRMAQAIFPLLKDQNIKAFFDLIELKFSKEKLQSIANDSIAYLSVCDQRSDNIILDGPLKNTLEDFQNNLSAWLQKPKKASKKTFISLFNANLFFKYAWKDWIIQLEEINKDKSNSVIDTIIETLKKFDVEKSE